MLKVKVDKMSRCDPPLIIDHYSVADRESLLGYPVGYVENVCECLDALSIFPGKNATLTHLHCKCFKYLTN